MTLVFTVLLGVGAGAAALAAIGQVARWLYRAARKVGEGLDVVLGTETEPSLVARLEAGEAARSAHAAELAKLNADLTAVRAKLASASLLNGKGDELVVTVRDLAGALDELGKANRMHISNSDTTHSAMWSAIAQHQTKGQ